MIFTQLTLTPLGPALLTALIWAGSFAASPGSAQNQQNQQGERVKGSHESYDANEKVDEYGLFVPVPVSHPGRRFPADDFPTGPAIGERVPDFELVNQNGELIDFHADKAGKKAALVFQRSVVW